MIDTIQADAAYDVCSAGKVLLCFSTEQDLSGIAKSLARLSDRIKIVRVEPDAVSTATLQLAPRHPTFVFFVEGAERFNVTGTANLMETLAVTLR